MGNSERTLRRLTHHFFQYYPDYVFCRTLAFNVQNNVATHQGAIEVLAKKARAAQQNREEIDEKLDRYCVMVQGKPDRIKDLSLREIMGQEDAVLTEIANFYFKHPYAHGRTKRIRLLPRWIRTFFLSAFIGHAKRRGLDLDYDAYFDMLTLL